MDDSSMISVRGEGFEPSRPAGPLEPKSSENREKHEGNDEISFPRLAARADIRAALRRGMFRKRQPDDAPGIIPVRLSLQARRALIAEMCAELSPAERAIARSLERRG